MSTIEGKKTRLVAVQSLSLFIECAVNIYIRSRKLFPGFAFSNHMRFGQSFLLCDVKSVKQYIKQLCSSIQTLFLHDRVKCFVILASDSNKRPIERFVIEFPEDFAKSIFYFLPPGSSSRTDLETNSICTEIFREALTHLERKLDRSIPKPGEPIAYWEALVDVKRSSAQATECMDMPSGWLLDSDAKFFDKNLARHPIKSTCIQESVVVLSYVDKLGEK